MHKQTVSTRNEALEFARRTRRNLEFIENAKEKGADVHAVTHLTVSLLGLVVFPKEKLLLDQAEQKNLADMQAEGWSGWTITLDDPAKPTKTLADILRHLRNAVAHGQLTFSSDSPLLEEVTIIVEDKKRREHAQPYWCARIDGVALRSFCLHFLDFIDNTVG